MLLCILDCNMKNMKLPYRYRPEVKSRSRVRYENTKTKIWFKNTEIWKGKSTAGAMTEIAVVMIYRRHTPMQDHFRYVCVFPGLFLHSRVTGACSLTTDFIMRLNVRTKTTTTTTTTRQRRQRQQQQRQQQQRQQQQDNNSNNKNNKNNNNNNNNNNNQQGETVALDDRGRIWTRITRTYQVRRSTGGI